MAATDVPPVGSRWVSWGLTSSRMKHPVEFVVAEVELKYTDLVQTKRTRRYTTKDPWGWPVYHPAGERTLLRLGDFGKDLLPADEAAREWLANR